jgi:hypothetical protein
MSSSWFIRCSFAADAFLLVDKIRALRSDFKSQWGCLKTALHQISYKIQNDAVRSHFGVRA